MFALVALSSQAAFAQERSRPGAGSVLDVALVDRAAAIRIRAEARARLLDALGGESDVPRDVLLEQAIGRYDAVLEVFPHDVDAQLERARALAAFQRTAADGHVERRLDEAITAYEAARAIDPRREPAFVAFELAVLHTQRGEMAAAEAEYARAFDSRDLYPAMPMHEITHRELGLIVLFAAPSDETVLANWAEVTMLAGDPHAAIHRYRAAIDLAARGSDSAALALWGLALAEERAGSHADAIETALRAIDADQSAIRATHAFAVAPHGAFEVLHLGGVFFEPACEIHAYESLGHEALASRASTDAARTAERRAARLSARFFLAEGGSASPYARVAVAAEARLAR